MIVEITTDVLPYDVVISCDKPGVINATPNVPITIVVDVKKDGIDGVNGKSAYEIAVDNGYAGTLEEFTTNLVDPDIDFNAYYILSKN